MEPNEEDLKTGSVQIEHTTAALRPAFPGVMISNGGYDKAKAEAVLAAGTADLVSFGGPFIANPDLPARFQNDAPLNTLDPATFYGSGDERLHQLSVAIEMRSLAMGLVERAATELRAVTMA